MASLADTLITNFVFRDNYTPGAKKAAQATDDFAKKVKKAQADTGDGKSMFKGLFDLGDMSGLGKMTGMLGEIGGIGEALGPIGIALGAIVAAVGAAVGSAVMIGKTFLDVGKQALEAYAPMDTLERTFKGIYGSAKDAKDMMSFLNNEAKKTTVPFEKIAQSAKGLALQGLRWTDYSNAIQGLAIRSPGGMGGGGIEAATNVVTRIKGGSFGEAFEELRNMGYSRALLTQMGLVFDKAGTYKGTMEQALGVIRKIGDENKGIVDNMNGGAEAGMGNALDAINQGLAKIGERLWTYVGPFFDKFTEAMSKVIDSGALGDLVDQIASIFNPDDNGAGSLNDIIASVLAGVTAAAAWVKNVWNFIVRAYEVLAPIIRVIAGVATMGLSEVVIAGFNDPAQATYASTRDAYKAALDAQDKKDKKGKKEPKEPESKIKTPLEQIANNTGETAKHVKEQKENWARHAFGGGDLGRMGVTAMELRGQNSSSNKAVVVDILNARSIEDIIRKAVHAGYAHGKRVGAM